MFFLKKISVTNRLILIFLGLLIPIYTLFAIVQVKYLDIIKQQTSQYAAQYIEKIGNDIENNIAELDKLAVLLQRDPGVHSALINNEAININERVFPDFGPSTVYGKAEAALLLLNSRQRIVASTYIEWTGLLRTFGPQWLSRIIEAKGNRVLISGYNITKGEDLKATQVVSIARGIFRQGRLIGYVIIEVPTSYWAELCEGVSLGNNGFVALIDDDDYVIFNTKPGAIGSKFMRLDVIDDGNTHHEMRISGSNMLVVEVPASYSSIRVVGAIPISELEQELNGIRKTSFLTITGLAALTFLSVILFSRRFCLPIINLKRAMRNVEDGDFATRVDENRADEFGTLQNGFNNMVIQLEEMLEKEYKSIVREQEARLNEMMAIINPHFIYNTLEAISMTAYLNDDEETANMIGLLGDIFRAMTRDTHTRLFSLRQEVELVESYLALINARNCGQVNVTWKLDSTLLDAKLMRFTLQPIVENCIIHGFGEQCGGNIWISIFSTKHDTIEIIVEDDGCGMDSVTCFHVKQVLMGLKKYEGSQPMALKNVGDRIQLAFGPQYGIDVNNRPDGGVAVKVTIPKESAAGQITVEDKVV